MMPIRILTINTNLTFSIRIKQALEKIGGYEVMSFTSPHAAFDVLTERPFDVVLVDFDVASIPAMDIILRLRSIQPDIGIIASPKLPEVRLAVKDLELDGLVDMPCTVRELLPVIHQAVNRTYDTLPDTTESPAVGSDSETMLIDSEHENVASFSSLDSVLVRMGGFEVLEGADTLDVDMSDAEYSGVRNIELVLTGSYSELKDDSDEATDDPDEISSEEIALFDQLAAEEPPMPSLEESGTISELRLGVGIVPPEQIENAIKDASLITYSSSIDEDLESSPAQVVLQATLDDSLTLEELVNNLIEQFPSNAAGIKPLPSWMQDVERYVREPDFLSIELPQLDQADNATIQTTMMSNSDDVYNYSNDMETDRIDDERFTDERPISEYEIYITNDDGLGNDGVSQETPAKQSDVLAAPASIPEMENAVLPPYVFDSEEIEEHESEQLEVPEQDIKQDLKSYFEEHDQFNEPAPPVVEDQVTRLALSLTQASLESTVEAILLVDNDEIIAHTGNMPFEDILELEANIDRDWKAQLGEARIRFVTLVSNGQDYMLYSRLTEDGLTLAMIFAGNMPLRVIRRQSERLMSALRATKVLAQDANNKLLEETFAEDHLQHLEEIVEMEHESVLQSTAELQAVMDSGISIPSISFDELDSIPGYEGPLEPHTYLWLVRDPQQALMPAMMQAISNHLEKILVAMGWQVNSLDVTADYVCLFAEVPADKPGQSFIVDLKHRSALISQEIDDSIDINNLWAEGYAVLIPGRQMIESEIQRFITFERMI